MKQLTEVCEDLSTVVHHATIRFKVVNGLDNYHAKYEYIFWVYEDLYDRACKSIGDKPWNTIRASRGYFHIEVLVSKGEVYCVDLGFGDPPWTNEEKPVVLPTKPLDRVDDRYCLFCGDVIHIHPNKTWSTYLNSAKFCDSKHKNLFYLSACDTPLARWMVKNEVSRPMLFDMVRKAGYSLSMNQIKRLTYGPKMGKKNSKNLEILRWVLFINGYGWCWLSARYFLPSPRSRDG
jgi:hypothetical protein